MTVADNTSRNQYTATSGQTVFAYTFEIVDKDDIVVLKNGTTLSEGTNYTVSGVGAENGGNVTLTVGATAGDIMTLYRDMAYVRTQNYADSGDFLASEVNTDFDNLWLAGEQTNRSFSQSIRKPITDSDSISMELPVAASRASSFLTFDAAGAVTTTAIADPSAPSSIFREQFTGDGTTTAFTLGFDSGSVGSAIIIYIDGVYQEGDTYSASGTSLVFTEAPPTNASIEVMYFKVAVAADIDTTGTIYSQQFTGNGSTTAYTLGIPPGSTGKALQIFINGVYQDQGSYTVSGATLTFSEAPPNTSQIDVIAFRIKEIGATDANLVTYTPAGTGAVPTTVQTKLRETVSVKDFGAVGDGVTDDTAAIQAALNAGGTIKFAAGNYKVTTQLVIKSNTTLLLDDNAIIRRAWAGPNGSRPDNATIKNENALTAAQLTVDPGPAVISTYDENISIVGGKWGHFNDDPATYRGTHISLVGVRGGTLTTSFKTQRSEWCTHLWVENFHIPYVRFDVAEYSTDVSNDGLHIIGGDNISVGTVSGNVDDDLVVIGSNKNLPIGTVTIDTINCDNTAANAFKVLQIRKGATASFGAPTESVKNVVVGKIAGSAANVRTGIIDILIEGHTNYDLIENVIIGDVDVEFTGTHDDANTITIDLTGGKLFKMNSCVIRGTPVRDIFQASNVNRIELGHFESVQPSKAAQQAFDISSVNTLNVLSGVVVPNGQAGFKLNNVGESFIGKVRVSGISNGLAAVLMQGTCGVTIGDGFQANRALGATSSKGIRSNSGATNTKLAVSIGADLTNVDLPVDLATHPTDVKVDTFVGMKSVDVRSLTSSETFAIEDGHLFELDNNGALYNFNPSGNFPDGWMVTINNVASVNGVRFDSGGLSVTVAAGASSSFYYSLAASAWKQLP